MPVSRFLIAMEIVKALLAGTVPKLGGNVNFDEGMRSTLGMTPMGAGLHDPLVICWPLVMGRLGTVKQKLMKLFVDVRDAT